jgi:uncharacterized protein (TIGR00730 family)
MNDTSKPSKPAPICEPPHPQRRHEPLPSAHPKPAEEDPDAPRRVQAILDSPSYRQADQDADFLDRSDTRGPRLMLDYLKTELFLQDHQIAHTIVVFGSTRIPEPLAARRRVERLCQLLATAPGDVELQRQLAVAKRIEAKSVYYGIAREFGRLVGAASKGNPAGQIAIMTGGGPGMMEAANRGSFDVGAESIGLNVRLPHEQFPNPYITPDLCFRFHYFAMRKLHFLLRAKALVVFPGGYGTFDELFETLTLVQTRTIEPVPIVLVGEEYWRHAVDIDFLVDEGVIDREDRDLFWFAETAEDIWSGILKWHEAAGEPLLPAASGAASTRTPA